MTIIPILRALSWSPHKKIMETPRSHRSPRPCDTAPGLTRCPTYFHSLVALSCLMCNIIFFRLPLYIIQEGFSSHFLSRCDHLKDWWRKALPGVKGLGKTTILWLCVHFDRPSSSDPIPKPTSSCFPLMTISLYFRGTSLYIRNLFYWIAYVYSYSVPAGPTVADTQAWGLGFLSAGFYRFRSSDSTFFQRRWLLCTSLCSKSENDRHVRRLTYVVASSEFCRLRPTDALTLLIRLFYDSAMRKHVDLPLGIIAVLYLFTFWSPAVWIFLCPRRSDLTL